ncbi:MAG: hypothetical protein ABW212_11045 [Pseudonocardia sediminis]
MSETTVDRRTARTRPGPAVPAAPSPSPPVAAPPSDNARIRVVLEAARAVVERGWLQNGWYETAPRPLWRKLLGPLPTPDMLEGACLVAAVAVAGHSGGAFTQLDRDSGPAIDRVWDALRELRGRRAEETGAVPPIVRRARMRELVRWNDTPGRTRDEVLGLLDRAISRTILDDVRAPSGR